MVSISEAVMELNRPCDRTVLEGSLFGMMPTDSLVMDAMGLRKARSTASLIFWSCEVSHRQRNKAIMAVTKSA